MIKFAENRPLCCGCIILFLLMTVGILLGQDTLFQKLYPPPAGEGEYITIAGTVYRVEEKEQYQKIYLKNLTDPGDLSSGQSIRFSRILIQDKKKRSVFPGEHIRVCGQVFEFRKPRNPGEFDEKNYYIMQGIPAGIWADTIERKPAKLPGFLKMLYQVRKSWSRNLTEVLGEKKGGVMSAMLLGEKAMIDPETRKLYTLSGIGHILAISGLHLTFAGWSVYRLLRRATGSFLIGSLSGIMLLGVYIAMIGLSVSALRAVIMLVFRIGAELVGRRYDSLTALAFSAVIVLLWRPGMVLSGTFWLSFGAVASLIIVYPVFAGNVEEENCEKRKETRLLRTVQKLRRGIGPAVCINGALLPIQLHQFYVFPTYAILLNLWVVPLMSVVLAFGLFGSLLCLIPVGGGSPAGVIRFPLQLCGSILWLYERACKALAYMPGRQVVTGRPEMGQIALYYLLCAGLVLLWKMTGRHRTGFAKSMTAGTTGLLLWGIAACLLGIRTDADTFRMFMLDVGQGDCFFICMPSGERILIDGGSSDRNQIGTYCIEPFLLSQGVGSLDYVFITHGDADHCNGITELLEDPLSSVQIQNLVLPEQSLWDEDLEKMALLASGRGVRVRTVKRGDCLRGDGERAFLAECIYPENGLAEKSENGNSVVISISYDTFKFLFTGDLEGVGETNVTKILRDSDMNWDVLKVAHHGSRGSTSKEFLDVVKPGVALISAGEKNRYGHPHAETLDRLEKQGATILSTGQEGAVLIKVKNHEMRMRRYRADH